MSTRCHGCVATRQARLCGWRPGRSKASPILPIVRRGILGGTFDPPHIVHLYAGEAAYRELGLDVVTFLPAGSPWQKADEVVSAPRHRMAMTMRAVTGVGYFEADDREVRRDGSSYTIDTLDTFQGDEVTLLVGADAAAGVPTWHRADELLAEAAFAVIPRPGAAREAVERALDGARKSWLDTPELALSGTELRRRASEGRSIRFLVPDPVWAYVVEHDLYRVE